MKLTIAQVTPFVAEWRKLRLTDDDLVALEKAIIAMPTENRPRRAAPTTTAAGRKLTPALKQVFDAVMSGNPHRGMTVREVEIADPPKTGDAAMMNHMK